MSRNHSSLFYISLFYTLFFAIDDTSSKLIAMPFVLYLLYSIVKNVFSNAKIKTLIVLAVILYFASMLIDTQTSKLYHPLIDKTYTLKADIYFTRYENSYIINTSKSLFRENSYVKLSKGKTITLKAFVRRPYRIFGPDYNLAIETDINHKVYETLDPKHNTRYNNKTFLVWSNNLFDTLGILNTGITDKYNRLQIPFILLFYLLYPFALLWLLFGVTTTYRKTLYQKYHFNILDVVIYSIVYYYVLMAANNDGFSGVLLGLPYAAFLAWEIILFIHEKRRLFLIFIHSIILIVAAIITLIDKSKQNFFYPAVGQTITIENEVAFTYGHFYINDLQIDIPPYTHSEKPYFFLKKGDTISIHRQLLASSTWSPNYDLEISSSRFTLLQEYINEHLDDIKEQLHASYYRNFHTPKKIFYTHKTDDFYISQHLLNQILKSQNITLNTNNRFESSFVYMSFYLLIYPVILFGFILIVGKRIEEEEYTFKKRVE